MSRYFHDLDMCFRRLKVVLYKEFLSPLVTERQQYAHSRSTYLMASMKTLGSQQLIEEETRPGRPADQIRWRISTAVTQQSLVAANVPRFSASTFKLASKIMSTIHRHSSDPVKKTQNVCCTAHSTASPEVTEIWLCLSADSIGVGRAAEALNYVLRDSEPFLVKRTVSGSWRLH